MKWLWLLIGIFIIQEPVSSNAAILEALQHGYHMWSIHVLFVLITLFDIVVGYWIGEIIHRRFADSRLAKYIERKMAIFSTMTGKNGQRIAIMVYGSIIFPFSAVLAPWLDIGFWDALIFMFLGEVLFYYIFVWIVIYGVKTFIPNPEFALYAVVIFSVLIVMFTKYVRSRSEKKKESTKS